jgi:carboxypeptidase C (cathepsin A)
LGIDRKDVGVRPDYSAELTSWLHSFTPAINHYIQKELKFKTDVKYNMFGPVRPWNNDNDNTREDLRRAMASNPYLKVLFQSGYYDGATTYFNAKYTMWQVDPSGKMKNRFYFRGYRSGHMMYLRNEDLIQANEDIRTFLTQTTTNGKAAKY